MLDEQEKAYEKYKRERLKMGRKYDPIPTEQELKDPEELVKFAEKEPEVKEGLQEGLENIYSKWLNKWRNMNPETFKIGTRAAAGVAALCDLPHQRAVVPPLRLHRVRGA